MKNKIISSIIIILVVVFIAIFCGYLMDNDERLNNNDAQVLGIESMNKTQLTISSEGPFNISLFISNIRNEKYFEGYDNNTLLWLLSLKEKNVFVSDNAYVIMNDADAEKINTVYITDAYIEEYIECVVVENRSLGEGIKDVLLVRDVKNLGNKTFFFDV